MNLTKGSIYILKENEGVPHPQVVILVEQESVTLCALTTNMNKSNMPGNVLLEIEESGLEKRSIVEVSKVTTIDRSKLGEQVGRISEIKMEQVLAGVEFVNKLRSIK